MDKKGDEHLVSGQSAMGAAKGMDSVAIVEEDLPVCRGQYDELTETGSEGLTVAAKPAVVDGAICLDDLDVPLLQLRQCSEALRIVRCQVSGASAAAGCMAQKSRYVSIQRQ